MMQLHVKCYHQNQSLENPHVFFILAKGDNAGKPSFKPWANSFMAISNNEKMKEFYFWLTYGLWKAGNFKTHHRGSVITFINLPEVRHEIREYAQPVFPHWEQYQKIVQALEKLEERKENLFQQIAATEKMQQLLFQHYFQKRL